MLKLWCAVVGETGSPFLVQVDELDRVQDLKEAIKTEKPVTITCDAEDLQLFLAKRKKEEDGEKWLTQREALGGVRDTSDYTRVSSTDAHLRCVGLASGQLGEASEADKVVGLGPIHLLVEAP
ncbi:hypothetical protein PHYSODRAFT_449070, partial [Phytophthora sojae]